VGFPPTPALLVPTKLTAPQYNPLWVRRDRLLARLSEGRQARLTLLVAPAGFGKSTLVAQWLGVAPGPVAWLNLDEHDQDPLRFLAYVAGAIERVLPEALRTTHPLLTTPEPPPLYVILQALLVDLNALPGGLTLVFDDYHTVTTEAIHQAVAYLLRHLPPTSRLVILSRTDPPLTLARLRAEQNLAEIRAADLRFTYDEAAAVVTSLCGQRVAPALVTALHEETEGWAIALQLAALAALDAPRSPRSPRGSGAIAEYLAEEVLDRQPQAIKDALLALAVPERVCAGLAAALLGLPDDSLQAEHRLDQLVRANLLLTPLDGDGRWYRFHNLFRELLLRRLHLTTGKQVAHSLHLRAAAWLETEGLFEEAVRCYLAAGEADAAGALIEQLLAPDLGRSLSPIRPSYWLHLLPEPLIARRPGLTLLEARIGFATLNIPVLAASLGRLETLLADPQAAALPPPWPTFPADLALLRGVLAYVQRRLDDAIPVLQAMLDREHGLGLTGQALMVLGRAYVAAGRYDEGVRQIEARRTLVRAQQGQTGELSHSVALCAMHGLAGSLEALRGEAEHLAHTLADAHAGDYWVCYAEANLGRAAYERSDLGAAARHFAAVVERRYQTNAAVTIGALTGLAVIAALRGEPETATGYAEETRALAVEVGSLFARNEAAGCVAHLAMLQGDLPGALAAAREIALDPHLGSSSWHALALPQLSQAAVLIAAGAAGDLAQAEVVVADVLAQVEAQYNARPHACALATLALLRQAQGRTNEALDALEQAVAIAAPRGYLRVLVDRGPRLRPLLQALAHRGKEPRYVARVLAALEPDVRPAPVSAMSQAPRAGLEVLTHREMEILALLAERWSDKEIAQRLTIAPNTVRKHTSTVYGKLGVNSRREAVEAARALGLLPASR
jgi:LuxR family transcriptional regulator, maltose regulon positive regulatory protein